MGYVSSQEGILFASNHVPKSDNLLIIWSYLVPYRPQNSQPDNPPGHVSIPGFLITSKRIPHLKRSYAVSGPRGPGTKKLKEKTPWRLIFSNKWNWYTRVQVRWYMMAPLLWNLVLVSSVRTLAKKLTRTTTVCPVPSGLNNGCRCNVLNQLCSHCHIIAFCTCWTCHVHIPGFLWPYLRSMTPKKLSQERPSKNMFARSLQTITFFRDTKKNISL